MRKLYLKESGSNEIKLKLQYLYSDLQKMICNKICRDDEEVIRKMKKLPTEIIIKIYSYTTIQSDNNNKILCLHELKPYLGCTISLSTAYSIGLGYTKIPYGVKGEFILINTVSGFLTILLGSIVIFQCCCKDDCH